MGLFSKKKDKQPYSAQQYAPPPGPPPPQGGTSAGQPAYGQQPAYGAPPPQSQQQQYAPPPPQHHQSAYVPPLQHHPIHQSSRGARGAKEDPLAALAKYDTFFLVDDSESMEMWWQETGDALAQIVELASRYDADGVDLAFFNDRTKATSKNSAELLQLFRRVWPSKSTPTASALRRVLDPYLDDLRNWQIEGKPAGYPRPKPMNLIVLTDGAPDRNEGPEDVIVEAARRLDEMRMPPYQLGIQFCQIGLDSEAAEHLQSLDDHLKDKHGIRDLVDTTLFDPKTQRLNSDYLLKALLGGMNRTIDARD